MNPVLAFVVNIYYEHVVKHELSKGFTVYFLKIACGINIYNATLQKLKKHTFKGVNKKSGYCC